MTTQRIEIDFLERVRPQLASLVTEDAGKLPRMRHGTPPPIA